MRLEHPRQWELVIACGVDEPGRLVFADRTHQRMDVRWRPLKYVPNMDLMLEKHHRRTDDETEISDLDAAPAPWRGVVRRMGDAAIVHAGRFFRETRWMVEVTVVWPDGRDEQIENEILASVAPQDPREDIRTWRAMGIDLSAPREFDVRRSVAKVGKVRWELATSPKREAEIVVERLAMPEYWLKTPLRDWLAEGLAEDSKQLRQDPIEINGHRAEQLISVEKIGTLSSLRGLRRLRLDLAWQCPVEARVYHVSMVEVSRAGREEIALPESLEIRCCRPAPSPTAR